MQGVSSAQLKTYVKRTSLESVPPRSEQTQEERKGQTMSDQEITQERDMTRKPDDEREEGTNEGQASISSRCQGAKRDRVLA